MGGRNVFDQVFAYLTENAGVARSLETIAADTGFTRKQISSALSAAIRANPELGVVRVRRSVYKYDPHARETSGGSRIFEEVGTTKEGSVVIQDNDGQLWIAEEL